MRPNADTVRRQTRRATSVSKRPSYWTTTTTTKPQQTAQELIHQLRAAINPAYFARTFLNFTPEPAQEHVLKNAYFAKRIALNCNRQWGKSTIAAILIAHRLYFHSNSTIIIVAPAGRQAGETSLKVRDFLETLDLPLKSDTINPGSLVLPNGSRLVNLPGVDRTARGFSSI